MKKRHSIHLLLAAAALLLATAACTKDELADGDRLPEGQYPLEIARITLGVEGGEAQPWGAPQTRVSENGDGTGSVFDAGDRFAVQIDGEDETGIYTVQDDGTATSDAPLYWTNTTPNRTVSAWYPATDGTLDLSDQSQSLAYLLYGTGTGDYQTPVTLTFTHQLAKVRVTPTDVALDVVQSLQLYTDTRCTYEKGKIGQILQESWIEMKRCVYNGVTCWEANVVPGGTLTTLRANGTEYRLSSYIIPVAGKFYDITLNYDPDYTITTGDQGQTIYSTDNERGLRNLVELVNSGKTGIDIALTDDITLTGEWTPIGTESQRYTGTFDGNNHTITRLTVTGTTRYAGLFGVVGKGGTVKDVTLEDVNISCVNNAGCVGGVVGWNFGGTVTGCCVVSGEIYGNNFVGGVAGTNDHGSLTGCYATCDISGGGIASGGVVGYNGYDETGSITACYHAGNISCTGYVGGVAGANCLCIVTACYWDSNLETGIGYEITAGETTKVDGKNVTWQMAVDAMNVAIEKWNAEQPLKSCNRKYELPDENSLPVLKKGQ